MTALEPDLRDTGFTPTVDPAQLVAPELPEVSLPTGQIDANLSGQRRLPVPSGARIDTSSIIPNLPDAQTAFARKYAKLAPALTNLPAPVRASLVKMDMQRVNKGQYPLSDKETLAVILAATRKQATTPPAEKDSPFELLADVPAALARDVAAVAWAVPSILTPNESNPLWQELTALDDIPEEIQKAIDAGDNPLTAILNAPGVRFLPGSFVAANLLDGPEGWKQLARHPGLATLDILPYAGKAAKLTKVGKAGALAREEAAFTAEKIALTGRGVPEQAAEAAAAKFAARKAGAHPIFDVLTKRLDDAGELEPNALGRQLARPGTTRPGQFVKSAFSKNAREMGGKFLAGEQRKMDARLGLGVNAEGQYGQVAREAHELLVKAEANVTDMERRRAIRSEFTLGRPGWKDDLTDPAERAFADALEEFEPKFQSAAVQEGAVGFRPDGEVVNSQELAKITKAQEDAAAKADRVARDILPKVEAEYQKARDRFLALSDERAKKGAWKRGVARELRAARDDMKRLGNLRELINRGEWTEARKAWGNISRRKTSLASPGATGTANIPATPMTTIGQIKKIDERLSKAADAEKKVAKLTGKAPERFYPLIEKIASDKLVERFVADGFSPDEVASAIATQTWGKVPGLDQAAWEGVLKDVSSTWRELKAQGYDPRFVPTLAHGSEGKLWGGMNDKITKASYGKGRKLGYPAPQYADAAIAFDAAAADMLTRHITAQVLNEISEGPFTKAWDDVVSTYTARARKRVESNPALTMADGEAAVRQEAERLALREWVRWEPTSFAPPGSKVAVPADALFIPKYLDRVVKDSTSTKFGALNVLDPITGTFRVSVLALSPRWHIYNIVGNSMMLLGTEGAGAFRYVREARKLIKDVRAGKDVLPVEIRSSLESGARDLADDTAWMQTVEGARLRRLMESAPAKGGRWVVQKSYQFNGFFDDMTKVMAYASGSKKALKRGWADDAAAKAGLDAARRSSAFWVEMTPFERGVLRKVFPFYSFTKKIMGLILQLPLDHPVRTAVMANFAAAELADMGDGLPEDWLNSIALTEPDEQGNQKRLAMSGLNPFSDAASLFTLKGFLSGMNPVFNTVLEQLGADTGGGSALFGTRSYDPVTGKLTTDRPALGPAMLGNVVPQLGTLWKLASGDAELRALQRNNSDAANRMIVGGLGLPTSYRTMNESEVRMKTELARMTAQREAWRKAVSTGDFSDAQNYPALRPMIAQLQALTKAGLLNQYHPYTTGNTGVAGLQDAFAAQAPWPT